MINYPNKKTVSNAKKEYVNYGNRGMNLEDYTDYISLRKFGSVPHSGFGLGLERIIMYVTGVQNIRDVILYPRTVGTIS